MIIEVYSAIVAVELLSLGICAVLFYANRHEHPDKTKKGPLFTLLIVANALALAGDITCYLLDGVPGWEVLRTAANFITAVMLFVVLGLFGFYLKYYLEERVRISQAVFKAFGISCAAELVLSVAAFATGELIVVTDYVSTLGPLYDIYMMLGIAQTLFCGVIITVYRKALGTHDCIAAYIYAAPPLVGAVLNFLNEDLAILYPATTLSMLILYVMVQADRQGKLEKEKDRNVYFATHDEMTGLLNRKAYIEQLGALAGENDQIGVLFGDVNGLKYENDHYGHSAGDNLIVKMAESLSRHFRREEIYRISGDEFVVLLKSIRKEDFDCRIAAIKETLAEGGRELASIGAEHGSCYKINELVQMAETDMYVQKEIFYSRHPELKR